MTNEAAERLHANAKERIAKLNPGQMSPVRQKAAIAWARQLIAQTVADANAALAAERRATVERIRAAVGLDPDKTHDKIMFLDDLEAILDQEAAR